ncbi:MAG: hydrogenase formation protein HypD [Planctomycetaceae bacterium]|nr:hydrogenase formation protein HypD [Planctomycetaceae bacterium]
MKYVDEFRDSQAARRILASIRQLATRRWRIMDVCGGQTHNLVKYGIEAALEGVVDLIHGPGCPVCVTPAEVIDLACELSEQSGVVVITFGDMLRVPGARTSLSAARAEGGNIRTVYSPVEAVEFAKSHPESEVVFFAVGFETTIPATALAVKQANALGLKNFSLLTHHVRVLPAMMQLMQGRDIEVDAFLAAGHVCTVTGFQEYDRLVSEFCVPVVITGFEPLDLLHGIHKAVSLLEAGEFGVANEYARSAAAGGNVAAMQLVDEIYEVVNQSWRGLGVIPASGYSIRECFEQFDARKRFGLTAPNHAGESNSDCRCGDVLQGKLNPLECPAFGTKCRPEHPLGAPMVSSEGACAAYIQIQPQPLGKT